MNTKIKMIFWRIFSKSPFELILIAVMIVGLFNAAFPLSVLADEAPQNNMVSNSLALQIKAMQNSSMSFGDLPVANLRSPERFMKVTVTAYNSVPWQTDATPCIGAQGTDICAYLKAGSNTCAANFVPLGTMLEVEDLGTCVVRDRMNARYWYRVDWYMGDDITKAKAFGARQKQIGIYPS